MGDHCLPQHIQSKPQFFPWPPFHIFANIGNEIEAQQIGNVHTLAIAQYKVIKFTTTSTQPQQLMKITCWIKSLFSFDFSLTWINIIQNYLTIPGFPSICQSKFPDYSLTIPILYHILYYININLTKYYRKLSYYSRPSLVSPKECYSPAFPDFIGTVFLPFNSIDKYIQLNKGPKPWI